MKNEAIKLFNEKYFSKKKISKKIKEFLYTHISNIIHTKYIYIELDVKSSSFYLKCIQFLNLSTILANNLTFYMI